MPRFRWTAMDCAGVEKEGVLDAAGRSEAVAAIRAGNLFPTHVETLGRYGSPIGVARGQSSRLAAGLRMNLRLPGFMARRVRTKQLLVLTRQLSVLLEAGLPLLKGLRIMLHQARNPRLREALSGIGEAVEDGASLSEALAMYPKVFDRLFVSMVKAGEAGGVLDVVLARLADFMEKAERVRRKVRGAMVYPVVVMVVAVAILAFLLVRIIPTFAEVFGELMQGASLPGITLFVIAVSHFVRVKGLYIVAAAVCLFALGKWWVRIPGGRYVFDRAKLATPLIGDLLVKTAVSRFARTLGTLLGAGVPVLQALNIVGDTAGNAAVARAVEDVHEAVKEGEGMTQPMEAAGLFPEMMVSMVSVGEETGAFPDVLMRVADTYDEEVDATVEGLTSVIEPLMIVILAIVVGTIVIAMFMPLVALMGNPSHF